MVCFTSSPVGDDHDVAGEDAGIAVFPLGDRRVGDGVVVAEEHADGIFVLLVAHDHRALHAVADEGTVVESGLMPFSQTRSF
jgi:hypothetical protein